MPSESLFVFGDLSVIGVIFSYPHPFLEHILIRCGDSFLCVIYTIEKREVKVKLFCMPIFDLRN